MRSPGGLLKRRGRAAEVLALVSDPGFQRQLAAAIKERGKVETPPDEVRRLALKLLGAKALDGVQVTFRWTPERQQVEVRVKGAGVSVDEQAGAGT